MRVRIKRICVGAAGGVCICLLFSGCFFRSRDVTVTAATPWQKQEYFDTAVVGTSGLFFETENLLLGKLLQDDLKANPKENLLKIEEFYKMTGEPRYLLMAADLCRWHATFADEETAVRYQLSALLYIRAVLAEFFKGKHKDVAPERTEFVQYAMTEIYSDACGGVFEYLKKRDLLDSGGYSLQDIFGKRCRFAKPVYYLSVPREAVTDFSLCANYKVKSLMLQNRRSGLGVPLVAKVRPQQLYKSLRIPVGLTIPVTALIRETQRNADIVDLQFRFQDTTLQEQLTFHGHEGHSRGNWPLALDFTTPLACYLHDLPDQNLISVMLNPQGMDKASGLYMIEPYNPDKIPVVFVHGLMSSPNTWVRMLNMLKSEREIRQRYQFWFYFYSSGAPVIHSARRLYCSLLDAQKEFCTTPEATKNFNQMVLIGHSMGGLITRLMLTENPHVVMETLSGMKWGELSKELSDEEQQIIQKYVSFGALPFVRRAIFMAVPHRGAKMAKSPIASLGVFLIKLPMLPGDALKIKKTFFRYCKDKKILTKIRNDFFTGIDNLDPDSLFVKVLSNASITKKVPYHSIIGNADAAHQPGGSDGIVTYGSSHLDGAESELIVHSGHSVHENALAMQEVQRILTLHLQQIDTKK